ncbi:hypothetical protein [Gelidibacter maritimus]|uniref:Uncharacterized protein n=1 Tax=Gelidibacter maritimus TaxID=2761487 RepID=A0A7W2M8P8_9FLAO|nr:hypothetical protein [Gelidibacter maritimus]MBA6154794.1 hypothetical protein [Gelidibacter maritimus]
MEGIGKDIYYALGLLEDFICFIIGFVGLCADRDFEVSPIPIAIGRDYPENYRDNHQNSMRFASEFGFH